MAKFFSKILLPILMREEGMIEEGSTSHKPSTTINGDHRKPRPVEKLRTDNKNNREDDDDDGDDHNDASKELNENSVKKTIAYDRSSRVPDNDGDTYWDDWHQETEKEKDTYNDDDGGDDNGASEEPNEISVEKTNECKSYKASGQDKLIEKRVVVETTSKSKRCTVEEDYSAFKNNFGSENSRKKAAAGEEEINKSDELRESRKRKRKSSNKKKLEKMSKKSRTSSPKGDDEETPPLPAEFKKAILAVAQGRVFSEEKLVIQKKLFNTDVDSGQGRLSIPVNQVKEEFLTDNEKIFLTEHESKTRKRSITVKIIDPLLKQRDVDLRIWEMQKPSGRSSVLYVLNKTWTKICRKNKFRQGDKVQLWTARIDAELCFALVKL